MIKKIGDNLDIGNDRCAQNFDGARFNPFRSFLFPLHFREIYYWNII